MIKKIAKALTKKKKIQLPPRYDEYMDLVTEQGFDAAVSEVQSWIKQEPNEPVFYRYLTTAYQQLQQDIKANESAAQYFILKQDSQLPAKQRSLRIESDQQWLNNLIACSQTLDHPIELFTEIAALCDGINQRLHFGAMQKLVELNQLDTNQLVKLCQQAHTHQSKQGMQLGLTCFSLLKAKNQHRLISHDVQIDLLLQGKHYAEATSLLRQVINDHNNADNEEYYFQLVGAQVNANDLSSAYQTLLKMQQTCEPNERLAKALKQISFWHSVDAQILPISEVKHHINNVFCYLLEHPSEELVLYVDDNLSIDNDLGIDSYNYPNTTMNFDLVVKGSLSVNGMISNFCGDTGCALIVTGDLKAKHMIGGGSEIVISGNAHITGALIGHYNHGIISLHQAVTAKLVWNDDHSLNYAARQNTQPSFNIDHIVESNHNILPLLQDNFREEVIRKIHQEYADDIADEGEDFEYPVYFSTYFVPELLAGRAVEDLLNI